MKELTNENVKEMFLDCLFTSEEAQNITDVESDPICVRVDGITVKVGLHRGRLEGHAIEIGEMLSQLPSEFKESGGGGWSFLNACNRADGVQWTGSHQRMDELLMLGMAIKKMELRLPRQFWSWLPGGMPYYVIKG